jgi:glutaminyl-peptide cyclotransferase
LAIKMKQIQIRYLRYIGVVSFMLLITWTLSCSGRSGEPPTETIKSNSTAETEEPPARFIKLLSPKENTEFRLNDPINVIIEAEENRLPDSVVIYFDGILVSTVKSDPWEFTIPKTFTEKTGRKSLRVVAFKGGKQRNSITRFMIIFSDVAPKMYSYKVVHTYPHDRDAFTQGLFYDNGRLYEGTGQEAGSSLREVELETGRIIRQLNLDRSLFGEGITLYDDRIYQVTWENKVGFVYEKSTFNLINKLYYATQGWGLTTVNDKIVMSDGSNVLYFLDPEMFTVVSRLEIYDNEKKVDQLNELEFIEGEIWANIWMTDMIARIDPVSGKVNGYINLEGLLPAKDRTPDTDVLNGIAYDKTGKRIFVTGKRWPKLFEIRVTEQALTRK